MLAAAGIGVAITLTTDSYRTIVGAAALAAVALLAFALVRPATSLFPWPLVILAALYAWTLGGGEVDQWSPVYAGAFLAVAELAYWSAELRGRAEDSERLTERRTGLIAVLALLGVAAAVGALVVVARLARPR